MRLLSLGALSLACSVASASWFGHHSHGSIVHEWAHHDSLSLNQNRYLEASIDGLHRRDTTGTCSDSTPCSNGACCSVSGFCGYSPSFCGTGNCTSNCDAKAECGEYAVSGEQSCPLNVCCSEFGFCGTTTDFCGTGCQSGYGSCGNVTEPSCSGSSAKQRIIAYYESWSTERACDGVTPEELNLEGFTHANMAFAYFDPSTFAITAMDATMLSLLSRFTAVKSNYTDLETWISVGGWSFSDPGSTETAWSTMVSSSSSRAAFIKSILQFMQTYGFDGVDLDWEYPGASDRGGTSDDGANFVSLVKEMRAAFGTTYGISATLPTSYWYLQGFKPVEMEKYVDWFNLMAYDLHGTWDATDIYVGPYIAPHTNLTEISAALDLLWRAGVTPGKVVLGQGWYGRSFTLADPSCSTPNGECEFTTGGNAGSCTATSGILSNAEIQVIIDTYDVTPVYDSTDAVNWIVWDTTQWVSYDDATTYNQKLSFANDLCLGGMMVWAADLNNQSAKTGYGTQSSTGYSQKVTDYSTQQAVNTQAGVACYTSNCGESCMSGYTGVTNMNGQPGYLPTADDCSGSELETLCCASGTKLGTCTWRGWRGVGLPCSGGCNSGETVIAQNTNHHDTVNGKLEIQTCNGGLQSYCCSDFVAPTSLETSSKDVSLQEDAVNLNPIVSVVVATVTEALANAAKSVIDAVATDFCDVAVPAFLEVVDDIELAIPIIGEILIAGEWIAEPEIVKGCEDLIEDGGDAVLSWLGYTSSLTVTDITETITETSTEDWECSPTDCAGGSCLLKRSKIKRSEPAYQPNATPTATPTPHIEPRAVDSTWGGLSKPATNGLDAWAKTVFTKDPYILTLQEDVMEYQSTAQYIGFSGRSSFFAVVRGLEGCTSVVLVSQCGVYMTHHWEPAFKSGQSAFDTLVIDPLESEKSSSNADWTSIPMLPEGCFSSTYNVKAIVFSRTTGNSRSSGSTTAQYPDFVNQIVDTVSAEVGIDESDVTVWLYGRERTLSKSNDNASGKLILTFNGDVFADGGSRAAYQLWGGDLVLDGVATTDNSQINTPMLSDYWANEVD